MKQSHKTIALWMVIIVMCIAMWELFVRTPREQIKDLGFSEFRSLVKTGKVESVEINVESYQGILKEPVPVSDSAGNLIQTRKFRVSGPESSEALLKDFEENQVAVTFRPKKQTPVWASILLGWLPMIIFFAVFFLLMRQIQAGGGKALSFGKSRARLQNEGQPKVTFENVAGVDEAKAELQEIIDFLKDPRKFTRLGGRIPKGVLLMGPPGTGKTLLAKAVAGEAGVPFFSISGSDFVEMFVGVGASRVRDLFDQGKKNAPCIIFVDEIDAVGRHRGAGLGGGHDEREQTLNQLLVEMDGFESNEGVIMIAATNRPDVLDPALLRPGRFDRRIMVPRPDVKGRLGILKAHVKRTPLDRDVDLMVIARGTPGFSGADLESLVNEAALMAARQNKKSLHMVDFEFAKDKVMMGLEHRSLVVSDKEKRNTAYHEAGHALVAKMIPDTDPIHKITIIPRGAALGITMRLPSEDRLTTTREQNEAELAILLGGRCAEELVFNEMTTGAANDIERATDLAQKMVCEWGMSTKVGPLSFGKRGEEIFLGREMAHTSVVYSEDTARLIDDEVKRLVIQGYERAQTILAGNRPILERVAEALLEREVLEAEEFESLVAGRKLKPLELSLEERAKRDLVKTETSAEPAPASQKPLKIEESPA